MYTHKNNSATFLTLIQFVVKHLIQSSAYNISLDPDSIYISFFLGYNHKCWLLFCTYNVPDRYLDRFINPQSNHAKLVLLSSFY